MNDRIELTQHRNGDDEIDFVLRCPFDNASMTPECTLDIRYRDFWSEKNSHMNYWLGLRWRDSKLTAELGDTKPRLSYTPLSGWLAWQHELIQEAPNVLVLRMEFVYSPNETFEIKERRVINIRVRVDQVARQ